MVDDMVSALAQHPFAGFRTRGRGDDRQPGELASQLDQDGADAAGAADDQQVLRLGRIGMLDPQAVEQQFPRGDGRQRQCGGVGMTQRGGLARHQPLIDPMQRAVGAGAVERTGIPDRVAGLEQRHLGAHGPHDARGIPPQDTGLARLGPGMGTDLHVDRIDGHRAHFDEQVAFSGLRIGQVDVEQRFFAVDRQVLAVGDGFHDAVLSEGDSGQGLIVGGVPAQGK